MIVVIAVRQRTLQKATAVPGPPVYEFRTKANWRRPVRGPPGTGYEERGRVPAHRGTMPKTTTVIPLPPRHRKARR